MSRTKEFVTAGVTIVCALGIGVAMQSGWTGGAPDQSVAVASSSALTLPTGSGAATPLGEADLAQDNDVALSSVVHTAGQDPDKDLRSPIRSTSLALPIPQQADSADVAVGQTGDACQITASHSAASGAAVKVSLHAPCHGEQTVTVHHNGMLFTARTDATGLYEATIPALASEAVFIFAFADGEGAVTQADVPEIVAYDRVVLQWRGMSGFELHAREYGAEYGESGHVWSGETTSLEGLRAGTGGHMAVLGDQTLEKPMMAEVYTFPAGLAMKNGEVGLSVEAEVHAQNCGLEIEAQTLELTRHKGLRTQNLTVSVPDCSAIGDYMVLNNVIEDLKIAVN